MRISITLLDTQKLNETIRSIKVKVATRSKKLKKSTVRTSLYILPRNTIITKAQTKYLNCQEAADEEVSNLYDNWKADYKLRNTAAVRRDWMGADEEIRQYAS